MTTTLQQDDIDLSPSAAARVAKIAARQGKAAILRLSVEGGGCAGFQYRFGLADAAEAGDTRVERDGVTLVVDEVSLTWSAAASSISWSRSAAPHSRSGTRRLPAAADAAPASRSEGSISSGFAFAYR
jgi:iron-sulfur cluster assembly accessory protein